MQPPASTPLVNWVRREKRKGFSPIVVFCGRQRSGKTAIALRFAWEIYPGFKYDVHFCKDIEQFANAYKNSNHAVLILDEASTSLYVYDWNSLFQKVFSIINDTQAYKQNIVFIVLPMVHKLGKLHRYDVDGIVQVTRYGKDKVFYKYQIQLKQYNDLTMRPPRVMTIVEQCGPVPLPPPHIWDPYIKEGQDKFKQEILDKQMSQIIKKLNPKASQQPVHRVRLTPIAAK